MACSPPLPGNPPSIPDLGTTSAIRIPGDDGSAAFRHPAPLGGHGEL